jgi:two-component system, cell cycle sensor histidine kinase and response regulator CckA
MSDKTHQSTEPIPSPENLRISEIRYRRLFESARDGILILDADTWKITDVNPFMMEFLKYPRDEFIGKELWEIGLLKDAEASQTAFQELTQKGYIRYEDLPLETKDGEPREVEFVSNVYVEDGQQVIQCNIRDITGRKRLENQLRQSLKMEAIGRLAGGVAHDFNNLLTAIIGYSQLIELDLDKDDPMLAQIKEIENAGHRATALTSQLLAISRKQVLQPKVLNLNLVVAEMAKMLKRLIGEDIELVTVLKSELENIQADQGQIEQILLNLAINARDALPGGGKLIIATSKMDNKHPHPIGIYPFSYLILSVSDNGMGMDKETQSHIFEPFFTTKELGKGTGLGLYTIYGIVKQLGGNIEVSSALGKGTTFNIYLPYVEGQTESPSPADFDTGDLHGTETILLVEDEEIVRKLVEAALKREGYQVLSASDAIEAIKMCEQHTGPIDMMLTDVVMPGMSGWELASHLTTVRHEMKVLFMSGYTENLTIKAGVLNKDIHFIQKPFTPLTLARKIREVLDAKRIA